MKYTRLALAAAIALALAACDSDNNNSTTPTSTSTPATTPATLGNAAKLVNVKLIGFNDFHGNLESPGNFSGKPAGGADYLAAYIDQLRAKNKNHVVISAGDLIGASPLVSAIFHDEPTVEAMNRIGIDFNVVGNHEFDEGKAELERMHKGGCHATDRDNTCKGAAVGTPVPFEGAKFQFLAANVIDNTNGKPIFPAYAVKTFEGVKVGIVGVVVKGTPTIVTPSGVAGLTFKDEADTINALIPELKAQGIEAVVAVIHEGATVSSGTENECKNVAGPLVNIVSRLDDEVDVVLSGHTHGAYNCLLPNKAKRNIPATGASAFGRLLTEIDLTLDATSKEVTAVKANNLIVDRSVATVTPNASIKTLVDNYKKLAAPIANRVIGEITANITRTTSPAGESAAGDLIADAQLLATQPTAFGEAVVAFMNPGGVRADFTYAGSAAGEGDGKVTYGESFTVQPFGNSLVTMTLTGQQIYDLLEQQWGATQPFARILLPSSGFAYQHTFDTDAAKFAAQKGKKFVCDGSVTLNGTPIDKTTSYRVTVNSFLADGGDNFTVLAAGTNRLGGAQDLDALEAWFKAQPGPVAPPAINRITKVDSCS